MTKHLFILPFIFLIAVLSSCDKLDVPGLVACSSHEDTDFRFEQSAEFNSANPKAPYSASRDDYQFYLCSDVHVDGQTTNTDAYVSVVLNDSSSECFSVCLGDMEARRGNEHLAYQALSPLTKNGFRLFCIPGNHDLFYSDWTDYFACWGSSHYCLIVNTPSDEADLYIFLDSANGTLGRKQRLWLEDVLRQASTEGYRHIIVMTHSNFFDDDLSQGLACTYQLEEIYDLADLFSKYNVECVLTGHDHTYGHTVFRNVDYYTLNCFTEMATTGGYYRVSVADTITLTYIQQR